MLSILLSAVAIYLLLVLAVWVFQERLIFVAAGWGRGAVVPRVEGIVVDHLPLPAEVNDGEPGRFRIAVSRTPDPRGAIVAFCGNGEDLRSGVHWAAMWREYGYAVVVAEFPGYGDSAGAPNAASLRAAAEAAARFARKELAPAGTEVVAAGSSMGSFCAVHLAAEGLVDRVVLRAPPSSILEAGQAQYWFLPVAALLRHPLDNLEPARRAKVPVLVLHGDRDGVVPQRLGRRLADAWGGPSEFVSCEGYGHNDLPVHRGGPFGQRIAEFLADGR